MLRVFLDPCQGKFPDDAAVAQYAKDKDLTAMSASEVAELLGKDPGVGWVEHDESGTYLLTVEAHPIMLVPFARTSRTSHWHYGLIWRSS